MSLHAYLLARTDVLLIRSVHLRPCADSDVRSTRSSHETHEVAARKEREMSTLKSAFGLKDVKEGDAFDRELQEQKKQERIAERLRMEKDKEKQKKV